LAQLFESLSYKAVLSRGYAIVRNGQDEPVRSVAALNRGEPVSIEFADGKLRATVGEGGSADTPRRKASSKANQSSLF
jgi:exodeoxyribonuclease VII large subunit